MTQQKISHQGFTLVELSIVLVIIGLIVSSVLVGQDLIRAGEIRAMVSQYEGFNAAVGTFKVKHNNQLPGDIAGNARFGYTGDGDGDGILTDGAFTAGYGAADVRNVHGNELVFFWNHLGSSGAQLINGAFNGVAVTTDTVAVLDILPSTRSGEMWGVFSDQGRNYYILGAQASGASSDYTTADVLSPLDALSIDEKIDDGQPGRGVVTARDGNATDPNTAASAGASAGDCVSAAGIAGVYNTDGSVAADIETTISCTLRFGLKI